MDPIDDYVDQLLARYQQTPEVEEAKVRLADIMHDAYASYQSQGLPPDRALQEVLSQFGHVGTSLRLLKIDSTIFVPIEAPSTVTEDPRYPAMTLESAQEFMRAVRASQRYLAAGSALLVASLIVVLLSPFDLAVTAALALVVAGGGALALYRRHYELQRFNWIIRREYSPSRQVTSWVKKEQEARDGREANRLMLSIGLWITALVPMLIGQIAGDPDRVLGMSRLGLAGSLLMIAIGLIVNLGGSWASTAAKYLD